MKQSKPIFLLGTHKSGTTLLRSLLDGHSQLFAIPFESHVFKHMGYWIDNEYRKQKPQDWEYSQTKSNFKQAIIKANRDRDPQGDGFSTGLLNEELFSKHIEQMPDAKDNAYIIRHYFASIQNALAGEENIDSNLRIVEKSVEHAEFAPLLGYLFPEAQFIHIVRNPFANVVSLRKYKSRNFGYPLLDRLFSTLWNNYYHLYRNQQLFDDKRYHVLKYEDLVKDPESSLTKISEFLNISYESILEEPTIMGKDWKGNSTTTGEQFSGISSKNLNAWLEEIEPIESYYVNRWFDFILRDFDYSPFNQNRSFWKKAKGENASRYFVNRMLRYTVIDS